MASVEERRGLAGGIGADEQRHDVTPRLGSHRDLTESQPVIPILYHENGDCRGLAESFPKDFHVD
jgi:hypothetical protein